MLFATDHVEPSIDAEQAVCEASRSPRGRLCFQKKATFAETNVGSVLFERKKDEMVIENRSGGQ